MLNLYSLPTGEILAFSLVFLRISSFVMSWPVFGATTVPAISKVLLALVLSLVVFPTLSINAPQLNLETSTLWLMVIREVALGLFLGYLMRLCFLTVSVAGEIIAMSIGLTSAQIYNPAMGTSGNVLEQFKNMLATLLFLAINGHHFFIQGLAQSFTTIPLGLTAINLQVFLDISYILKEVIIIGLKISVPILISIFLANLTMGILGKAVPQINILVTSLGVQIVVGFAVLFVMLPLFILEMDLVMNSMSKVFQAALGVF